MSRQALTAELWAHNSLQSSVVSRQSAVTSPRRRSRSSVAGREPRIASRDLTFVLPGTPQLAAPRRVAQLAQRLGFDLANALAGHGKLWPTSSSVCSLPSPTPNRILMTFSSRGVRRLEHRVGLLLEVQVDDRVGGRHDLAILDEVAKM